MGDHLYSNPRSVKMAFKIFLFSCFLLAGAMANQEVPEAEIEEMNTMLSEVLGSDLLVPHGEKELIASTRSFCCYKQKMCKAAPLKTPEPISTSDTEPETPATKPAKSCEDIRSCHLCITPITDGVKNVVRSGVETVKDVGSAIGDAMPGLLGIAIGAHLFG